MLKNLKAEMARKNITQQTVADVVRVDSKTVSNWISEKHEIPFFKAREIRDHFFNGLSLEYLFESSE